MLWIRILNPLWNKIDETKHCGYNVSGSYSCQTACLKYLMPPPPLRSSETALIIDTFYQGFKDHENCGTCGEEKAEKKCTACKSISYCNQVSLLHSCTVHNTMYTVHNTLNFTMYIVHCTYIINCSLHNYCICYTAM